MWLGPVLIFIFVITLLAGIFAGGAFTIVLVPIAFIAFVTAAVTGAVARRAGNRETRAPGEPRPTPPRMDDPSLDRDPGEQPGTPEDLLRARQRQQ